MKYNHSHTLTTAEYHKLVQATACVSRAHRHAGMANEHSKELMMDAINMLDDIIWRLGFDEEVFGENND